MDATEIRETRLALGLTQAQLAELVGAHHLSVNRWENQVKGYSPSPYQEELLTTFRRAAEARDDIGERVVAALAVGGVIAALFLLLSAAVFAAVREPERKKPRRKAVRRRR